MAPCQAICKRVMKKPVPFFLFCLLLQGCVGGGIIKSTTGQYSWYDAHSKIDPVVYTSNWLTERYGKPASVSTNGLKQVWTYQTGWIWAGVMPVIVVPIPLAVPVGKEKTIFVLRDDRIVSATQSAQQTVGGAVGFTCGPCNMGFSAFSLEGFPK